MQSLFSIDLAIKKLLIHCEFLNYIHNSNYLTKICKQRYIYVTKPGHNINKVGTYIYCIPAAKKIRDQEISAEVKWIEDHIGSGAGGQGGCSPSKGFSPL